MKTKFWMISGIVFLLVAIPLLSVAQNSSGSYHKGLLSVRFELHQFIHGGKGTIDNGAYLVDTETGDVWVVDPLAKSKEKIKEG
ncbi:hypothetical protein UR09_03240 [Candidatus Nitromaritima sp. SCGC AAA799-A02]|nr:hypothetical protein UR09_03240 [Candidatus Nitromaritima sp. SCGC AAA799-A02]